VQSAAAAVPAVLGAAGITAATMLMPQQGATAATTVIPSGVPGEGEPGAEDEVEEKKRSPWTWPLIVLIALLAIVLIGTIIAFAVNAGNDAPRSSAPSTPPPTTASQTPTPTPTPTPTQTTPTTAQINPDDYIGLSSNDASAALVALGMVANAVEGNAATSPDQAGLVYAVNPTGPVPIGSEVTITYYAAPETPAAPAAPTVDPAEVRNGESFRVSWPAATCPAGQTLSGYQVAVDGPANAAPPLGAGARDVTISTTGEGTVNVTLQYFCGQLSSPASPATPVNVIAGPDTE
jgi:serine/threonine-protein kinase